MICIHMFFFVIGFNMLIPELNDYITDLGKPEYKWMNLGLWTIAAGIIRPVSGKIADNVSRKAVMYIGVAIGILCCFAYPLLPFLMGYLMLRFVHGFSTGFQPTGVTALIADIIPKGKRGEAMGIFGVTMTVGFSLGNGIGSLVKNAWTINGLFITSGVLTVISLFLILTIKEDKSVIRKNCEERGYTNFWQKIIPKRDELFGVEVIVPSVVMFLTALLYGFYLLLMPDITAHLGIANKGLFFFVNVAFMVATRLVSGKMVDRYGARRILLVSLTVVALGSYMTAHIDSLEMLIGSSIVYGIGASMATPAVMAWTADLANPIYKGRGMGTMFIFLEFGILFGTLIAQLIYQNDIERFDDVFLLGTVLMLAGVVFLMLTKTGRSK